MGGIGVFVGVWVRVGVDVATGVAGVAVGIAPAGSEGDVAPIKPCPRRPVLPLPLTSVTSMTPLLSVKSPALKL